MTRREEHDGHWMTDAHARGWWGFSHDKFRGAAREHVRRLTRLGFLPSMVLWSSVRIVRNTVRMRRA